MAKKESERFTYQDIDNLIEKKRPTPSSGALFNTIKKMGDDLIGVEIGVWKARNMCYLLDMCSNIKKYIGVDPYIAYNDRGDVSEENAVANMHTAIDRLKKYGERTDLVNGTINDLKMEKESVDFFYIDGDHTYDSVSNDIETAWELLKPQGLIFGHDIERDSVRMAVNDFAKENDVKVFYINNDLYAIIKDSNKELEDKYFPNYSVMVCTPAYNSMVTLDWVDSIAQMQNIGVPVDRITVRNESLITRARNILISNYYLKFHHSHLLWLDADVYLPADGLKKMLKSKYDVIAAPVRIKSLDKKTFSIWGIEEDGDVYAKVKRVATGALMLSRKAVEALVNHAKENGDVYPNTKKYQEIGDIKEVYDIFKLRIDSEGIYLSEDYYVCDVLRELGFEIWVDKTINTYHSGNAVFKGFDNYVNLANDEIKIIHDYREKEEEDGKHDEGKSDDT